MGGQGLGVPDGAFAGGSRRLVSRQRELLVLDMVSEERQVGRQREWAKDQNYSFLQEI